MRDESVVERRYGRQDACPTFKALVVVLCALVLIAACHEAPRAPTRPFQVPSTAAWAGGADGGVWIDCWRVSDVLKAADGKAHPEDDAHFDCSIYDQRGAIQKKARFTLDPAADPRRVMRYQGYDGVRILLDDGRVLQ